MKNVTVTMPLSEFEKLNQKDKVDPCDTLNVNCDYISDLVDDVVAGRISEKEAPEFYFFQTKLGKNVLKHLNSFRAEDGR